MLNDQVLVYFHRLANAATIARRPAQENRPVFRPIATILLCAAAPISARAAPGISYDDARSLPAARVIEQVLPQLAGQFVALRRPEPGRQGDRLLGLEFSTLPGSAGYPGLCAAKILFVRMDYDDPDKAGRDAPAHAADLALREVFGVVGPTDPLPDLWNQAYGRQLESDCQGRKDGFDFFSAANSGAAYRAARLIGELIPGPGGKARSRVTVTCGKPAKGCDPKAMLPRLGLSSLADVEDRPCNAEAPEGRQCTTLTFAIDRAANQWTVVRLAVVLQDARQPVRVIRASITAERLIAD